MVREEYAIVGYINLPNYGAYEVQMAVLYLNNAVNLGNINYHDFV